MASADDEGAEVLHFLLQSQVLVLHGLGYRAVFSVLLDKKFVNSTCRLPVKNYFRNWCFHICNPE